MSSSTSVPHSLGANSTISLINFFLSASFTDTNSTASSSGFVSVVTVLTLLALLLLLLSFTVIASFKLSSSSSSASNCLIGSVSTYNCFNGTASPNILPFNLTLNLVLVSSSFTSVYLYLVNFLSSFNFLTSVPGSVSAVTCLYFIPLISISFGHSASFASRCASICFCNS